MTTPEAAPKPRFLTTQEVADILRSTRKFIRSEIEAGALKASFIGRVFLIEADDLEEYINERRVKPSAQGRGEAHE